MVFGRLLLDFDAYVAELEHRGFERARADGGERPPRLSGYQTQLVAAALAAAHVEVGEAALVWAVSDLDSEAGALRFREALERLASEDGWVASAVVWLNESRIEDVRAARLERAREHAEPKLAALDPNQRRVVETLWDEHGSALLDSLLALSTQASRSRGELVLIELEDRVRSSLNGHQLPTEDRVRDWIDAKADATSCALVYTPTPELDRAVLRAECGGVTVARTIELPRLDGWD